MAKTEERNGRDLPSLLDLWPKQRGERTAAFLYLSVCGQNRGVKGARPSFTSQFVVNRGVKGVRPSFTSRFVAKTEG